MARGAGAVTEDGGRGWHNKANKALIMFLKLTVTSNASPLLFNVKEIPNRGEISYELISDRKGRAGDIGFTAK
jgi:hypothetical protein